MNVSPDYDKLKNSISTIHLYVGDIKSMNDIDMLDYSTALNYSKVSPNSDLYTYVCTQSGLVSAIEQ